MPSGRERSPVSFLSKRVYWTVIPFLALAMLVTTAVAGIPGIFLLKDAVGPERIGYVYVCYGIIALSTIVLESLFFYTGIYLVWKLTKRIASLTGEMQTLTRSVLHDISTPVSHIQHQADLLSDPDADLRVADTGVGMTADEKSRAFERFYRADKSRNTPGSGLGLSLVHAIVGFYNGTIAVESAPNRGTVFTVTLS